MKFNLGRDSEARLSQDFLCLSFVDLIKIRVRTSDLTLRSYFGKQNSTLGSVVPLAMFCS